ncbi:MAG: UbiA family prenyltransferase [Phycisphaerae bacterium]|nr:UbiA family prenyltransferase [Phycisphaerae bacterium]
MADADSSASRSRGAARGRAAAWLELLRLPNLLTVPGDPLVGLVVATSSAPLRMWLAAPAASVFLYAAGLVQNDWADRRRDARDRPDRPLPSGRVAARTALVTSVVLLVAGLAAARFCGPWTLATACGLVAAITCYNLLAKRLPVIGPLTMGVCRALSVGIGLAAGAEHVAAGWPGDSWPGLSLMQYAPAGLIGAYVTALTAVAQHEGRTARVGWVRDLPAGMLAVVATWVVIGTIDVPLSAETWHYWASLAALLAAVLWAGRCAAGLALARRPDDVQRNVGRLVRGVMLLQAWLLFAAGDDVGLILGGSAVALFVVAGVLSRRFASS